MNAQEDTEAIARRIFEEMWQNNNYDVIDELVSEDYVLHDPSMPEETEWPNGRDGYRQMAEMGSEIIDGPLEIEQLLPAGDHVVIRWKQTGAHVGEMEGLDPTNEEVTVTGIEIDRFEDGQLAETWQYIGMVPMLTEIAVISEDLFSPEAS